MNLKPLVYTNLFLLLSVAVSCKALRNGFFNVVDYLHCQDSYSCLKTNNSWYQNSILIFLSFWKRNGWQSASER